MNVNGENNSYKNYILQAFVIGIVKSDWKPYILYSNGTSYTH